METASDGQARYRGPPGPDSGLVPGPRLCLHGPGFHTFHSEFQGNLGLVQNKISDNDSDYRHGGCFSFTRFSKRLLLGLVYIYKNCSPRGAIGNRREGTGQIIISTTPRFSLNSVPCSVPPVATLSRHLFAPAEQSPSEIPPLFKDYRKTPLLFKIEVIQAFHLTKET